VFLGRIAQALGITRPLMLSRIPDILPAIKTSTDGPQTSGLLPSLESGQLQFVERLRAKWREFDGGKNLSVVSIDYDYERLVRVHRIINGTINHIELCLVREVYPGMTDVRDARNFVWRVYTKEMSHYARTLSMAHMTFILLRQDYKPQFLAINELIDIETLYYGDRVVRYERRPAWLQRLLAPYHNYNLRQIEFYKSLSLDVI